MAPCPEIEIGRLEETLRDASWRIRSSSHLLAGVVDERCRRASRRVDEPLLHRVRPPYHHNMSLCGWAINFGWRGLF